MKAGYMLPFPRMISRRHMWSNTMKKWIWRFCGLQMPLPRENRCASTPISMSAARCMPSDFLLWQTLPSIPPAPLVNYAISVEELIPILDRNNIPYDPIIPTPPEPTTGENTVIPAPTPQPRREISPAIIAVIAVAAIALIAAAVFIIKGKKTQTIPSRRRPMLYSIAPEHGGRRISLEGQQIQIGRDPALCQIAFRDSLSSQTGRQLLPWGSRQRN